MARSVRELAGIEMVSSSAKEGLIFGKTSSKCWLALKVQSVQSKLRIPYFGFVARSEWGCLFALKLVVNSSVQYVNKRHILDTWYHAKPYYNDAWVQDKSYLEFQMLDFDGCPKETTAEVFSKKMIGPFFYLARATIVVICSISLASAILPDRRPDKLVPVMKMNLMRATCWIRRRKVAFYIKFGF